MYNIYDLSIWMSDTYYFQMAHVIYSFVKPIFYENFSF